MGDPLPSLDYEAFARDLDAIRAEVVASLGDADFRHLRRMERWGRACTGLGYATAWLAPNPVSAVLISLGSTARWTILMHHVGHGGMDRIRDVPPRYTSKHFAVGRRRLIDWFDWMLPEAWHYEHNVLHHYHTNETLDPDLVELNAEAIRQSHLPALLRYVAVGWYAMTWKISYYAPNTFQVLRRAERAKAQGRPVSVEGIANPEPLSAAFDPRTADGRRFWRECVLPYGLGRFVVIPLMFAPLGPWAAFSVWANSIAAEIATNVHTFAIIAPNHAGDDMHRYDRGVTDRAEFYVRQVLGSVNFRTGGDLRDFLHGFLNYQIEHHLWPDLPPCAYQRIQPAVKAVCARHGVPYVQEPLTARVKQLVDIIVGKRTMQRSETRPKSVRKPTPQPITGQRRSS
ncbi:MAG: fatty acid desaturase [Deltaproteobacteria bacterium]